MKELGIFCQNPGYSGKLADYLTSKIDHEFCIVIYSDKNELLEAARKGRINTLITGRNEWEEVGSEFNKLIMKIICLTEDRRWEIEGITCIYKYMPASVLIPEIVSFCHHEEGEVITKEADCNITGVYSPIGGVGTTSFSIALSEIRGKNNKILYVCLEPFSAVAEMLYLDDKITITEAMYSYLTGEKTSYEIDTYVQNADGFDVVLPSRSYVEINSIQIEKLKEWIIHIKSSGKYSEIVVELSEGVNSFVQLFDICDKIIILKRNGIINRRKAEIFERELSMELSEKKYKEKVFFIDIPEFAAQEDTYESMEETEMGRWLSGIIGKL